MPSTRAACPHCGKETLVTLPTGKHLEYVTKRRVDVRERGTGEERRSTASCQMCGTTFYAYAK